MFSNKWLSHLMLLFLGVLAFVPATAQTTDAPEKCPYQKLQILVPDQQPAPGTESGYTGETVNQTVGVPFEVLVRATVDSWETHTGVSHVVLLMSTDDTAELPDAAPLIEGEARFTVTFNSPGAFTITAKDLTDREHFRATSSVIIVNDAVGLPAHLRISPMDDSYTVGEPADVTVEVVDADGNPVSDASGELTLAHVSNAASGPIPLQTVTLSDGAWTGQVTFRLADVEPVSIDAGSYLTAELAAAEPLFGTSDRFIVAAGPYARTQILLPGQMPAPATDAGYTGVPASQVAGITFPVRVYATDEFWNPVRTDAAVVIESADTHANTPLSGTLAGGAGQFDARFGTAGTWNLTVRDAADAAIAPMTSLDFQVTANNPTFVIGPVPETVTAGISFTATITVNGPDGQPLDDYAGPARLACEIGPGSMTPEEIVFENGQWLGQVTLYGAADEVHFSCVDYTVPPNIGTSDPLRVIPNEFAGLQIVLEGESLQGGLDPALTGEPADQWAGQALDFRVLAVDAWSNHVPDIDADVELVVTDPYADLPDTVSLAGGRAVVPATLYRAGNHTFDAQLLDEPGHGIAGYESTPFKVHPGPYAKIIVLAPGEELVSGSPEGKVGDALDQSISYAFHLDVLATDQWWNPRNDVDDEIELTVTDPLGEMPAPFALYRGEAEKPARLSTGGYQLITATNLTNPEIAQAFAQVRAINSGFHIEAQIAPDRVIAGEPFTLSVVVTNDAGAVMQEINSRVNVQVLNASTGEPGKGKLLNTTFQILQGRRTISQNYTGAEPIILVVSDDQDREPGITNPIHVDTAPASELRFDDPPNWVGGRKSTLLDAMVTDEFGNGIDNIPVRFSLTGGQGSLDQLDQVTNLVGVAQAKYTGHFEPEVGSVKAEAAGFATELIIETALVNPDLPAGSITNYPNPFHPDEGETTIAYKLASDAEVTLSIWTLSGTMVWEETIQQGDTGGRYGDNTVLWDGRNGIGEYVASGGYIVQVEAKSNGESIHKMRRRIGVIR